MQQTTYWGCNSSKAVTFLEQNQTICLLNDSFPPLIDGVANAVTNYAGTIHSHGGTPIVITPDHPDAKDESYPYKVIRYPSMDLRNRTGYMAGIPFSPDVARKLSGNHISLLHSHCPIVSTMLARELRQIVDAPLVLTYHTKFDIDIANILKSKALQDIGKRALLENINACDEVWAVSRGAAENLHSLGYEGECVIMQNGVDLPRERVGAEQIRTATEAYNLPEGIPVFLFVGRIMWYKGLRIILDALAKLRAAQIDFRMVFIGGGGDYDEVTAYSQACGLTEKCIFTGPIHSRDMLRAWYCRADLFLFPSTFDTNGLVVREAAACSLASVLIEGSCAAEGITDNANGFLIQENADSLFHCLLELSENPQKMAEVGFRAGLEIYISWEDAVKAAMDRYQVVIDRYNSGECRPYRKPMEGIFRANGDLMEGIAHIQALRHAMRSQIAEHLNEHAEHLKDIIG